MTQGHQQHFVDDGAERARTAIMAQIRAEVTSRYADRLQSAGWLGRLLLKQEIRREVCRRIAVNQRLDDVDSPWNVYFSS